MQFIKVNPNYDQNQGKGQTKAGNPNKQTNPEGEAGTGKPGHEQKSKTRNKETKNKGNAHKCSRITYKTPQGMMR